MSCDKASCDDFEDQLSSALITRPAIEQAKGVLVTLRCATPDQAYAELRQVSDTNNVTVRDLAAALVTAAAGFAPDDPALRKVVWHQWGHMLPASGVTG